ncbi:MAG: flagellar hook-associated protein FlgK [Gammaproteobacteria bacterium]|nr:flagellar hook-associated protein FlgK [Gammaproteobacteria bacterium]
MADIYNTAITGLLAYRTSIATTSNNITNVNTDGYSRQRTNLVTNPGVHTTVGTVGTGVRVGSVVRLADQFDARLINQYQSGFSRLDTMSELTSRIDDVIAAAESNLTPAIDSFFGAVSDVANNPSSVDPRQVMLGQGEVLVERFHYLAEQMDQLDKEVDTRIGYVVQDINALASEIANLNKAITRSSNLSDVPPSDLLDNRELLLKRLSEKVEVNIVEQDNGEMNVFIGNGQLLISSGNTFGLRVDTDLQQPDRYTVFLDAGTIPVDVSKNLHGGEIGALVDFRRNILDTAMNRLGRIAIAMSDSFNQQHRAGLDLNAEGGGNFFNIIQNSPDIINNTAAGTLFVQVGASNALADSNYRFQYNDDGVNAPNYDVIKLSDGSVTNFLAAAPPFVVDGLTFTPGGVLADGESFDINAGMPLAQALPHADNSATADIEVQLTDISQLTASDYEISYNYGRYIVTRLSDGADVSVPGSPPLEIDGMRIIPTGMVTGDSFYIRPTRNAALRISLEITNPRDIAAANPYRLEADIDNLGDASMSLLSLDNEQIDFLEYSASITGTVAIAPFNYAATNAVFDLTIDGVTRTVTVNLNATTDLNGDGPVDANDTAFAVQAAIDAAFAGATDPGATVSLNGNNLSISSNLKGIDSHISVANSDLTALAQLGIDNLAATGDQFAANITFKDAVLPATGIVFDVTDAAGNILTDNLGVPLADIAYVEGMDVSVGAWTVRLQGSPVAEDSMSLAFNTDATNDNRNVIELSSLDSFSLLDSGTSTYSQAYGVMIAEVGTQTATIRINREAENVLLDNAIGRREEKSGVNLDEEAANLIRFQQAYTAITRVVQTAQSIFQAILDVV